MALTRRCANPHCRQPLSPHARVNASFCSSACRVARWKRRARTTRALARKRKCEVCRQPIGGRLDTRREDARYCSAACRKRAYRQRKRKAADLPTKAHQRIIRERMAAEDVRPAGADLAIGKATVRAISREEAKHIIERYEFLGTMPTISQFYYGIFFGDHCGGVAVFGPEQGENLGVWNRYGYGGKIIALQRGACLPWAHPHAASKLIRGSMRLLPEHIKVVTATVDPLAGEIGGIYQSCGFDYVGQMCNGGRALLRINGETMSERQAGRLFGTSGARALAKLGFEAISVPRKGRYFAFRGTRAERKKLRAAITHLLTAYPKRGTDTRNAGAPAAGNA